MIDPEDIERRVRLTELNLQTELPSWRDRMVAVAAESFELEDAAAVVARCAELSAASVRPGESTVTLTAEMLALMTADAQGDGPHAARARRALLSLARRADEKQNEQEETTL